MRPGKDGTWVVKDRVDGDVWIVKGDYQVGDILSEEDMVDAVGDGGDLDGSDVNKDSDGDGIKDYIDRWPDIPNLPNVDPTVPGNQLPDGSTVPDPNAESPDPNADGSCPVGQVKNENGECVGDPNYVTPTFACDSGWIDGTGACVPVDDPRVPGNNNTGDNTENTGVNEGDSCTLPDGSEGTIQDGVCTGTGNDAGPGEDGNGGEQVGNGNKDGLFAGASRGSTPTWTPLPRGTQFRRFNKRQPGAGMMSQIQQSPALSAPQFSRDNIYNSMFSSLMKGKS